MDYKQIKLLLEKYYNGQTSVNEEQKIIEYLSKKDIAEELSAEKELFLAFRKMSSDSEPAVDFKDELAELIDKRWEESTRSRFRKIAKWSAGIAAGLTLAFIIYSQGNKENDTMPDTFTNEQEAYVATKEALILVSEKLNMANNKLSSLELINSNLKIVNSLNKVDKMIDKYKSQEK